MAKYLSFPSLQDAILMLKKLQGGVGGGMDIRFQCQPQSPGLGIWGLGTGLDKMKLMALTSDRRQEKLNSNFNTSYQVNSNFNTSLSKLLVLVTIPYRAWLLPIPNNALSFLAPTEAHEIQMSVCPSLIHVFTLHVNVQTYAQTECQ